jgi:hypothetical protein
MKIVFLAGAAAIIAGGVYLHGPLRNGETYDRSVDDAYETVRAMPMPPLFARMVENVPGGDVRKEYADRQSVSWHFTAKGREGAVFRVEFAPAETPGKVYVSTSYENLDESALLYDGSDRLMSDPELFEQMARVSLREQVDARLERRPFDKKLTQDVLAGWTMKNMDNIQREIGAQMNEVADTFKQADEEARLSRQRAEAARFSSAKPMNDARPTPPLR